VTTSCGGEFLGEEVHVAESVMVFMTASGRAQGVAKPLQLVVGWREMVRGR